jgi:endonuclease/exonuclease/phosphatase (EEP) superfamily protein YafD
MARRPRGGRVAAVLRGGLLIMLAGLAGATLATLLARQWWVFDGLTHFRLQYLCAGLLLALGLALLRSRAGLIALLFATWHGWIWWDVAEASGRSQCAGRALSVVAFNLEWSNPTPDAAVEALRAMAPDILMVAENWRDWGPHLEALAEDFPGRAPADWRTADRPTLFSKFPILDSETVRPFDGVVAGSDPLLARAAWAFGYERAVLDLGDGARVTVVGVHAPYPLGAGVAALRHRYLAQLAAALAAVEGPLILLGDLNATPWSPDYRDLVASAGLVSASGGHIATWPVWSWILRVPIDHILVRGGLTVLDAQRGPDLGSDHFPVVASLCLEIAPRWRCRIAPGRLSGC